MIPDSEHFRVTAEHYRLVSWIALSPLARHMANACAHRYLQLAARASIVESLGRRNKTRAVAAAYRIVADECRCAKCTEVEAT